MGNGILSILSRTGSTEAVTVTGEYSQYTDGMRRPVRAHSLQCCEPPRELGKYDGAGIELKFVEPPEARKPNRKWRLYIFKAGEKDAIKGASFEEHCGTALRRALRGALRQSKRRRNRAAQ